MRSITCAHCQRTFTAADASWDRAAATGACPHCGKLLDPQREQAAASGATDPEIRRSARSVRRGALAIAMFCFALTGVLVIGLRRLPIWIPVGGVVLGVAHLGIALFYSSRDEARNRMKHSTDLSRFE